MSRVCVRIVRVPVRLPGPGIFFYPGSRAGRVKVSKVVEKNGSAHAWPDSNLSSTRMSGYAVGGQVFGVPEFRSWQKFPNINPLN